MHPLGVVLGRGDLTIHLFPAVRVVGQSGINLPERQLRMVQRQFLRAPPVGDVLADQMKDLEALPRNPGLVSTGTIQMFVSMRRDWHNPSLARGAPKAKRPEGSWAAQSTESLARACQWVFRRPAQLVLLSPSTPRFQDLLHHCWASAKTRSRIGNRAAVSRPARPKCCSTLPPNTRACAWKWPEARAKRSNLCVNHFRGTFQARLLPCPHPSESCSTTLG